MDISITLQGLLLGALAIGIGLAFAFWGFRVFLILLPIWGFFAGFIFGANGVDYLLGDGFLATTTGWVVGFLLGLLFAVLSYLYSWVAVILLQMPAVLVIVATAISGAGATIAGVAIGLGLVDIESSTGGIFGLHTEWDLGWLGIIAAVALAFAGAIYQTRTIADMSAAISADSYMNPGLDDRMGGSSA